MFSFINSKIWLYQNSVDFRKQINGLMMLLADRLNQDPTSGHLYIFRSRKGDRIKMLWWDRNGFWLLYKRLEKGRFKFPEICDKQIEITADQLGWLLSGINMLEHKSMTLVKANYFY